MGFIDTIKVIGMFWKDLAEIVRWLGAKIEQGMTEAQLKKDMEAIVAAFDPDKSASETAGELDDIFKN